MERRQDGERLAFLRRCELRDLVPDCPDDIVGARSPTSWLPSRTDGINRDRHGPAFVDVAAFLVDAGDRVVADEDFVFFNAPVSKHSAVTLSVDGDSEQSVRVDLGLLSEKHQRILVAAALERTRLG